MTGVGARSCHQNFDRKSGSFHYSTATARTSVMGVKRTILKCPHLSIDEKGVYSALLT